MMAYEDQFSQYPTVKGIAVELPFVKIRYVKVDRGATEKPKTTKSIDLTVPDNKKPSATPSQMIVSGTAVATTMGVDPMISQASVIHELTYGRIETAQDDTRQSPAYPAVPSQSSYSLDIII